VAAQRRIHRLPLDLTQNHTLSGGHVAYGGEVADLLLLRGRQLNTGAGQLVHARHGFVQGLAELHRSGFGTHLHGGAEVNGGLGGPVEHLVGADVLD
jgi:hypothetical protein